MVARPRGNRRREYRGCGRTALEEEVLARLRPSRLERLAAQRVAWYVKRVVERVTRSLGVEAQVTVEGSYAKDTWLSGDLNLDVFVLIDRQACLRVIEEGELLRELRKVFSSSFPVEERYAQHPYLRVNVSGVWVEVVPGCVMEPGGKPLTAVDRTPLHRRYVVETLTAEQRDEVRLLKAFMKAVGVYGAEIAVQGFSGYLVELLIASYGCFRRVLEEASKWRPPVAVTPPGTGPEDLERLRKRYPDAVMLVPDPVDPERNAAAAVSLRTLAVFVLAARTYLRKPSLIFFEKPRPPVEKLPSLVASRAMVIVEMKPPGYVAPDNLWGMARKAARNAASLLERLGFGVVDYDAYVDEEGLVAYAAVEVLHAELPWIEAHEGPPVWSQRHAERFVELHAGDPAGPWVSPSGKLVTLRRRRLRTAVEALDSRRAEWVPGSMKSFSIRVLWAREALEVLGGDALEWLYRFAVKAPHWLRPDLYG